MRRTPVLISAAASFLLAPMTVAAEQVPAALIRIPESIDGVFVAETSAARFVKFERRANGVEQAGEYYMSIGELGDGKETAGDKRTPLGIYFITEQLDTSRLHEKYGVTAFPLDYPNAWDERLGRDGDGIWIHGVYPNGGRRPERDTDGCIALPNEDLLRLAPSFTDNLTPVIVTRELAWSDAGAVAALREELQGRIAEWLDSRVNGDLHAYLSLYDAEFSRWSMNRDEWAALELASGNFAVAGASLQDLLLLAYPAESGLYLSRFRLSVVDTDRERTILTRLYWRRDQRGALRIIAENVG